MTVRQPLSFYARVEPYDRWAVTITHTGVNGTPDDFKDQLPPGVSSSPPTLPPLEPLVLPLTAKQTESKEVDIPFAADKVAVAGADPVDAAAFGSAETALVANAKGDIFYTEFNNYFSFGVDAQIQHQVGLDQSCMSRLPITHVASLSITLVAFLSTLLKDSLYMHCIPFFVPLPGWFDHTHVAFLSIVTCALPLLPNTHSLHPYPYISTTRRARTTVVASARVP
jgi:hypothetical protein